MLAMCQLGITVCSLLILNVSEPSIHHLLEGPLHFLPISEGVAGAVAFVVTLLIVSYLHVVLGEMVPKNVSFSLPERAVLLLATPLVFLSRLFRHVIAALNAVSNGMVRLVGVEPKTEAASAFTLDEVATIVNQSQREGLLDADSGPLTAAFEFTSKKVRDVAVPRADIVTLTEDATPADVERAVAKHGFSRYVLANAEGDLAGYVHVKDVIDLDEDEFDDPIPPKRVRRVTSIFADTDLEDALATMRRGGIHLARVFDASGTTMGALFLEDVIEELVGEVNDETRRARW
jgi:CBS domain containing-hemolysin-like protein